MRDKQAKEAFIQYLKQHPEERFFQAVRNFSGMPFIVAMTKVPEPNKGEYDTWNWEDGSNDIERQRKEYVDGTEEAIIVT